MSRKAWTISLILYGAMLAAVVLGMQRMRAWSQSTYGTTAAQEDWDAWREEAAKHSGEDGDVEGPVERRTPKSDRPPALVLMDDHYGVCVGFAILLSTVLFATLVFMFVGATRPPAPPDAME